MASSLQDRQCTNKRVLKGTALTISATPQNCPLAFTLNSRNTRQGGCAACASWYAACSRLFPYEVLAHTPYLMLLCTSSTLLLLITKNLAAAGRALKSARFTTTRPPGRLSSLWSDEPPGARKEEGGAALPFCLALMNLLGAAGVAFGGAEGSARFFRVGTVFQESRDCKSDEA